MEEFECLIMKDMSDTERLMFQSEMNKVRKNRTTALLLTLLLGGVGAHRYYLGDVGLGVVYTLFCFTFVPTFVAFIELFLVMGRTDRFNETQAKEISLQVKALVSNG